MLFVCFVLIYVVLKHIRIVFKIHIPFMLDRSLQDFRFPRWDSSLSEYLRALRLFCKAA
jgi:hypothetical protein